MIDDPRGNRHDPKDWIDIILDLERDLDAYTDEAGDHLDQEKKAYLLPILMAKMDHEKKLDHLDYIASQNEQIISALKEVNSNLTNLQLQLP